MKVTNMKCALCFHTDVAVPPLAEQELQITVPVADAFAHATLPKMDDQLATREWDLHITLNAGAPLYHGEVPVQVVHVAAADRPRLQDLEPERLVFRVTEHEKASGIAQKQQALADAKTLAADRVRIHAHDEALPVVEKSFDGEQDAPADDATAAKAKKKKRSKSKKQLPTASESTGSA